MKFKDVIEGIEERNAKGEEEIPTWLELSRSLVLPDDQDEWGDDDENTRFLWESPDLGPVLRKSFSTLEQFRSDWVMWRGDVSVPDYLRMSRALGLPDNQSLWDADDESLFLCGGLANRRHLFIALEQLERGMTVPWDEIK